MYMAFAKVGYSLIVRANIQPDIILKVIGWLFVRAIIPNSWSPFGHVVCTQLVC